MLLPDGKDLPMFFLLPLTEDCGGDEVHFAKYSERIARCCWSIQLPSGG